LILAFSAYAVSFDVKMTPIKYRVNLSDYSDKGEFKITISNSDTVDGTFRIKPRVGSTGWDIAVQPFSNPILIDVPAKSAVDTILYIRPTENVVGKVGSYAVSIEVIDESTGQSFLLQPTVSIGEEPKEYIATVVGSTDFPEKISPKQELSFKITLANQNKLDIKDAKLIISSGLINEERDLEIVPNEEKVIEVKKSLDPKTKPGKGALSIRLVYNGKDVLTSPLESSYEIVPYSEITDVTLKKKSFLRRSETIKFTNQGNVPFVGNLSVPTTWAKSIFSSTSPKSALLNAKGKYYYNWETRIAPYESVTVTIRQNYIPLAVLIIALIIILALVFIKKEPMTVSKELTESEKEEESFLRGRIQITLRNNSPKPIKDITIVDKLQQLFHIEESNILGTMKPTKLVRNKLHQTLAVWNIEELAAGEERVITYFIRCKIKIIGGLTLLPTVVRFRLDGKETHIKSKPLFIE
jgi:hypothetical protein